MWPTLSSLLIIILFLGFPTSQWASPISDSLWHAQQQAMQLHDWKNQSLLLCQLGRWLSGSQRPTDIDSGITLAKQAVEIAETTHDSSIIATAVIYLAGLYDSRNETARSLQCLRRALKAALVGESDAQVSLCCSFIAKAFFRGGNFTEAFSFATKGYALAEHSEDQSAKVFAAYELSRCYWAKKECTLAEQYDSLAFAEAAGDVVLYNPANCFRAQGVNAFAQHDYKRAIEVWKKGIAANQQIGEPLRSRFLFINIAFAYRELKEYDLEDSNIVRGIELHRAAQDTSAIIGNLWLLASHRESRNNSKDADSILNIILGLSKAVHDSGVSQAQATFWQGQLSVQRGKIQEGYQQFQQALLLLDTSATDDVRLLLSKNLLSSLADAANSLAQWKDAAKWLKELEYVRQRHRFQSEKDNLQEIDDLFALQRERANLDVFELERQSSARKIAVATIIVALLLAIIGLLISSASHRRRNAQQLQGLIEELKNKTTVLWHRNKQYRQLLNERQDLMAIAAHDIKTPLIGIRMGVMQLQEENKSLPENSHHHLHQMKDAASHVLRIVNRLMDYAVATMPAEPALASASEHGITAYTQMILDSFEESAIQRSLKLELAASVQGVIPLQATIPYYEIMENLLSNAIKYAPFGTTITISIHQNNNGVDVGVHDVGAVITSKDCEKIFKKGSRLHLPDETSHGVGLFAARRTAESEGWKLRCRVESGTSFVLSIPNKIV